MELSPGKQRMLLVVFVILLVGTGVYLAGSGRSHGDPSTAPSPGSTTSRGPVASPPPSALTVPPAAETPTPVRTADICGWLPFTQRDLDAAANVTTAFAAADETFSYSETPTAYGHRLSGLVTPTLLAMLEQQFQPPGAAAAWRREQLTSRSGGTIDRIIAFGSSAQASITFGITLTEQVTASGKTTSTTGQYNVTAVAVAGHWQVNDIEQAGAGNR